MVFGMMESGKEWNGKKLFLLPDGMERTISFNLKFSFFDLTEYLNEGSPMLEKISYLLNYGIYTSDSSYLSNNGVSLLTFLSVP